ARDAGHGRRGNRRAKCGVLAGERWHARFKIKLPPRAAESDSTGAGYSKRDARAKLDVVIKVRRLRYRGAGAACALPVRNDECSVVAEKGVDHVEAGINEEMARAVGQVTGGGVVAQDIFAFVCCLARPQVLQNLVGGEWRGTDIHWKRLVRENQAGRPGLLPRPGGVACEGGTALRVIRPGG